MSWRRAPRLDAIDRTQHWRSATYCVIDVETTGLDLRRDEIVSIGTVAIQNARIDVDSTQYTLVHCARTSSIPALQVHCLRPDDLADGVSPRDAAIRIDETLAGSILIAHAAWIEQAFVGRLLSDAGRRLSAPVVDTAVLARACGFSSPSGCEPALEDLAVRLGLPVHTPHHALGDAMTTATVFLALVSRLERSASDGRISVSDLLNPSPR